MTTGDTTLPVFLLHDAVGAAVSQRTAQSVQAQSVRTTLCTDPHALAGVTHEYTAFVLAGTELEVTACERAVWFLHTRPGVLGVTGAVRGVQPIGCAQAAQFVVARTEAVRAVLSPGAALHPATAIALVIGLVRGAGRGIGTVTDPLIRTAADATRVSALESEARAALTTLGIAESQLFDTMASGLPANPVQRLVAVPPPPLTVCRTPTTRRRVLVLLQGFPMGGYTAFNADLLPRLAAAGHAVTTCTMEVWRTDWRLHAVQATSPDVHHATAAVPIGAVPAYLDWLITTRAIEVVLLSHTFLGFHTLPWLRARHPDVAFVDYVHTDWFETGMYGSYTTMAMQWTSQLDAQLATSEALVQQLVDGGCDADGTRAAHIGIDTKWWQHAGPRQGEVRASLGAREGTLVMLFAGRLSPEKRPHLAVEVLRRLREDGHDVVLVFAGGGPLLLATHDQAVALGLADRCRFLGEIDEAQLKVVYAAADLFLATSAIEGIARSLYEAMAMGCVPVVSDVGGQRELVVPGVGSLVDASRDDAAPYVHGVRPFLDPATLRAASAAARARVVAQFDSVRTVQQVTAALELGLARRPARQTLLPEAIAEELAVLGLEVMRRHVIQASTRR